MAGEIFISYRRADQPFARQLHSQLRAEGVEAWYDALVEPGEDWRIATAQALEASKIFVLLFSENAAQSSDIAKELAAAVLEKKLIVPVRLQDIAPKGAFLYELASRNWINAYEDTETRLAELARGLAHLVRTGVRDESLLPFERAECSKTFRRKRRLLIATAAITLIATSAAATWMLWPESKWTVESSRPFVSTLALEGDPAFSPDGKVLAYASGTDRSSRKIYVRNVAGGNGIKVTSDVYDDGSPSWSSDGARLAYIARKAGEPCRIMVASVPGGEARQVGRCALSEASAVSWQPNTSFLYYIDRAGPTDVKRSGLNVPIRLDLSSGEQQTLAKPSQQALLDPADLETSPDGKSLLLVGRENASTIALVIHDLASGTERVLGKIPVSGAAVWAEDSRSVLAATARGIGSEIIAYPINGAAPYHVYAAAINVSHLAAGSGGLLALETDPSRQNLARARAVPAADPDVIDPANGRSWAPTFAPDGTLAFLSNRSGTNAIWTIKPGASPTLLYDAGFTPAFRLEFSPDGKYLAMPVATNDGVDINILTSDGAAMAMFHSTALGSGAPTWTADSKAVIALDKTIFTYMQIDIANPAHRRPAAPRLWSAVISHGGGTFAALSGKPGYWQIGLQPRLVTAKYPVRWDPPPELRGEELLVPDFDAAGGPRILAQPLAGGPDRVLAYLPGAITGNTNQSKMAVNPRTGEIIYVAAVQSDSNIDLLTLARH
jgi:Tol biopolymer transport system component